jgi:hypothetical protein
MVRWLEVFLSLGVIAAALVAALLYGVEPVGLSVEMGAAAVCGPLFIHGVTRLGGPPGPEGW